MKIYHIKNWNELYENNRSRTVSDLSWVKIPNRHDGENYTTIITHKDGAKIFAAWILMIQVASRCQPRGTLLRDNKKPHTSVSLSTKTRAPKDWFDLAIKFLIDETDWIEVEELADGCQATVSQVAGDCQAGDEEERREDKKEESTCDDGVWLKSIYPEHFEKWWTVYPKKKGKGGALKEWNALIRQGILPPVEVLIAATLKAAASHDWLKDGGKYIVDPERWLKRHCWLDGLMELQVPEAAQNRYSIMDPLPEETHAQTARRIEKFAETVKDNDLQFYAQLTKAVSFYNIKDAGGNPSFGLPKR